MNKLIVNEQEIVNEYLSGLSYTSIATLHGINYNAARNILIRNNVKSRPLSEAIRSKKITELSLEQKQIIEGLLLGDGSVFQKSRTANLRLKSTQEEFVSNVRDILPFTFNVYTEPATIRCIAGKKCHCMKSYALESLVDLSLNDFRKKWYVDDVKIVPNDLSLSPLLCKYWFYGDGSSTYIKDTERVIVSLSTDCFTFDECLFLSSLFEKLNLHFTVVKHREHYRLQTRKKNFVNGFLEYIGKSDLLCYDYKWKYHNGIRPYRGHHNETYNKSNRNVL